MLGFTKQDAARLVEQIAGLRADLKVLKQEKQAAQKTLDLSADVVKLREELELLRIAKGRQVEENERERREVEHMVGLERRRQEFEIEQARRETKVDLREAALTEQRARFEEQMKFVEDRLATEVRYLKDDIVKALLERLPTWNVDRQISETVGAPVNGSKE